MFSRRREERVPIYEYRCTACQHTFEVMQKFSDPELTTHEGCGGTVERVLSAPAFQLKGSGWYVTDYGKGGKKPGGDGAEKKADDGKAGEKKESGESKTEAKAESKSEAKPASESKAPAKSE